jgi:hypothetical protein
MLSTKRLLGDRTPICDLLAKASRILPDVANRRYELSGVPGVHTICNNSSCQPSWR